MKEIEDIKKEESGTVRVRTKWKTRGRPSNNEKKLWHLLNYLLDGKKEEINEWIINMIMYWQSTIPLSKLTQ